MVQACEPRQERACALSPQSRWTLCDPIDCSPPGSLSMGFPRREYWSELLCPSPRVLPTASLSTVVFSYKDLKTKCNKLASQSL